jgi:DNA-binding IscR family transcriptional regulator
MPRHGDLRKGLYALRATMMLARHMDQGAIRIRDIAYKELFSEKILQLILLELKNVRIVDSVRGAKGGTTCAVRLWKFISARLVA